MSSGEVTQRWRTPIRSAHIQVRRIAREETAEGITVLAIDIAEAEAEELHRIVFDDLIILRSVDESFAEFDISDAEVTRNESYRGPLQIVEQSELIGQLRGRFPWIEDHRGSLTHYRINDGDIVLDVVSSRIPCFAKSTAGELSSVVCLPELPVGVSAPKPSLSRPMWVPLALATLKILNLLVMRPLFWVLGRIESSSERTVEQLADALLEDVTEEVSDAELPKELRRYVAEQAEELSQLKFRRLGSTRSCRMRVGGIDTWEDLWVSDDGAVLAMFTLSRSRRFMIFGSLPPWLFPERRLSLGLESWLSDGRFVETISDETPATLPKEVFLVHGASGGLSGYAEVHRKEIARLTVETGIGLRSYGSLAVVLERERVQRQVMHGHFKVEAADRARKSPFKHGPPPSLHEAIVNSFSLVGAPDQFSALLGSSPKEVSAAVVHVLRTGTRREQTSALFFVREAFKRAENAPALAEEFRAPEFKEFLETLLLVPNHELSQQVIELMEELHGENGTNELEERLQQVCDSNPFSVPWLLGVLMRRSHKVPEIARGLLKSSDFLTRWGVVQFLDDSSSVWREWHVELLDAALRDEHPLVRAQAEEIERERRKGIIVEPSLEVVKFDDVSIWFGNQQAQSGADEHTRAQIEQFIDVTLPRLKEERLRYSSEKRGGEIA